MRVAQLVERQRARDGEAALKLGHGHDLARDRLARDVRQVGQRRPVVRRKHVVPAGVQVAVHRRDGHHRARRACSHGPRSAVPRVHAVPEEDADRRHWERPAHVAASVEEVANGTVAGAVPAEAVVARGAGGARAAHVAAVGAVVARGAHVARGAAPPGRARTRAVAVDAIAAGPAVGTGRADAGAVGAKQVGARGAVRGEAGSAPGRGGLAHPLQPLAVPNHEDGRERRVAADEEVAVHDAQAVHIARPGCDDGARAVDEGHGEPGRAIVARKAVHGRGRNARTDAGEHAPDNQAAVEHGHGVHRAGGVHAAVERRGGPRGAVPLGQTAGHARAGHNEHALVDRHRIDVRRVHRAGDCRDGHRDRGPERRVVHEQEARGDGDAVGGVRKRAADGQASPKVGDGERGSGIARHRQRRRPRVVRGGPESKVGRDRAARVGERPRDRHGAVKRRQGHDIALHRATDSRPRLPVVRLEKVVLATDVQVAGNVHDRVQSHPGGATCRADPRSAIPKVDLVLVIEADARDRQRPAHRCVRQLVTVRDPNLRQALICLIQILERQHVLSLE